MMFTVRLSYECEELMPNLDDPRKQAIDKALKMARYETPPYTLIHVSASKENQE